MTLKRKIQLMVRSFTIYCRLLGIPATIRFFIEKHVLKVKELKILLKGTGNPIYLRNFTSDLRVFGQLFINEEYKEGVEALRPEVLIDAGANIGLASLYFNRYFPDISIYAFEPENSNYNLLEKNTRLYPNIHIFKKAVWHESRLLSIIKDTSHDSFSVKEAYKSNVENVEGTSINDFLRINNISQIDLLKIDIEGAEYNLFSKNTEWLLKTKTIIVEIHERLHPGSTNFINNLLSDHFEISYCGEYTKYTRR